MLYISSPIVMGILNATPDSFYTKGQYFSETGLISKAQQMIDEGASILDIGGVSTRPGAAHVTEVEELNRVIPVVNAIRSKFPDVFISVDTYRSSVAKAAVEAGADIINDISAGTIDENLLSTVASLNVPYILMHMQGTPENMQQNPEYDDVAKDVFEFFKHKIITCQNFGIKDIILDPGFGFGKTIQHNYQLLKKMHVFRLFDLPILAGISRKSMLYKLLDITPEESLNATTAGHLLSLQQGACILRAHDVKEAVQTIKLFQYYNEA